MADTKIFRVVFQQQNEVFEVYAKQIFQSDLWGFVEVEEFVFGERSQLLVDPGEEKLKSLFEGVKRSFIPVTAIIRVDEVEKSGPGKIAKANGSTITQFPSQPQPKKDG